MKSIIIVAHPDDEILFFSSLFFEADKIVVCFSDCNDQIVSAGRRELQNVFPHSKVEWLDIQQSSSYLSSDWDAPQVTESGLFIKTDSETYLQNFELISSYINQIINGYDTVYTHNPWGEYGHEEHVLVFNAILKASQHRQINLLVSGYRSDRSLELFRKRQHLISGPFYVKRVPLDLCYELKNLYTKYNCWTFTDDYQWPELEIFLSIKNSGGQSKLSDFKSNPPTILLEQRFAQANANKFLRFFKNLVRPIIKKIFKQRVDR